MDAGTALDAEVARAVLGLTLLEQVHGWRTDYWVVDPDRLPHNYPAVPPYSTDIAAAWLVVERMRDDGWVGIVTRDNGVGHYAEFWRLLDTGIIDSHRSENESSCPLAICLAALDAIADKQGA